MSETIKLFYEHPAYIGLAESGDSPEVLADYQEQFELRGFDDTAVWNLDVTIAKFVTPRLEAFILLSGVSVPYSRVKEDFLTKEEWTTVLNKILEAFRHISSDDNFSVSEGSQERAEEVRVGLSLFAEYFGDLWL